MNLPKLKIKDIIVPFPIIQGGMGIGYSNYILASSVAKEGGVGVLSSAGAKLIVGKRHNKKFNNRNAIAQDVRDTKSLANGGIVGINIMVAVVQTYESSILGAMDGGVDIIISGAGLPLSLPEIAKSHERYDEVALVPIASSARAFDLICKKWKKNYNRLPDAVIVEGPLAGGHLAWRDIEETELEENKLENLVSDVLEVAREYGGIPVIAAGGIYDKNDILKFLDMGCSGVQMGTRFLATVESGASKKFKDAIVNSSVDDIVLSKKPGSPCGLLFRVLKKSPFYLQALNNERDINCSKALLLNKKGECKAKENSEDFFCICNGLLAASDFEPNEKELYTVGSSAHLVNEIVSVKELMSELTGV